MDFEGPISFKDFKPNNDDTFIIGAGFGRTGTLSLQQALAILGYKVYHMKEVGRKGNEKHMDLWSEAGKLKYDLKMKHNITSFDPSEWNKTTIESFDWDNIFAFMDKQKRIYQGTIDHPGSAFYFELMKYYSKYKVILTVRENAEVWFNSWSNTVTALLSIIHRSWFLRLLLLITRKTNMISMNNYTYMHLLFDGKVTDKEYTMNKYNEWIDSVKLNVPNDKLLIFNVKQGWEPLCAFLGQEVPTNEPFPRSNSKKTWISMINIMRRIEIISNFVGIVGIAVLIYFVWIRYH